MNNKPQIDSQDFLQDIEDYCEPHNLQDRYISVTDSEGKQHTVDRNKLDELLKKTTSKVVDVVEDTKVEDEPEKIPTYYTITFTRKGGQQRVILSDILSVDTLGLIASSALNQATDDGPSPVRGWFKLPKYSDEEAAALNDILGFDYTELDGTLMDDICEPVDEGLAACQEIIDIALENKAKIRKLDTIVHGESSTEGSVYVFNIDSEPREVYVK